MSSEPESLILQLLRDMRADIAGAREELGGVRDELKGDIATLRDELKSDMHSLRTDVAADLIQTRKELGDQIVGLRRAVIEYHTSVIGHGIIISEPEARMRRVEQHLELPPLGTN